MLGLREVNRCLIACLALAGCARTDVFYPSSGELKAKRAVVLNGTDSLGSTVVSVSNDGVRFSSAGGLDNSTSTRETMRVARAGISAAITIAALGAAAAAYASEQAAASASNVAASRAAAAGTVARSNQAIRLAEIQAAERAAAAAAAAAGRAIPAAGSTIQSTIPAVVTPVVP